MQQPNTVMQLPTLPTYSPFFSRDIETGFNYKNMVDLESKVKDLDKKIDLYNKDFLDLKESFMLYKGCYNWSFSVIETLIIILFLKAYNII